MVLDLRAVSSFAALLSFCYMILSRNFIFGSFIAQVLIALFLLGFYLLVGACKTVKPSAVVFLLFFPLAAVYQGVYVINLIAFFCLFEFARKYCSSWLYEWFFVVSVLLTILSVIVFMLDGLFFYDRVLYQNQLLGSIHRLLGLDGSPAILSIIITLGVIVFFGIKKNIFICVCFLLLILCMVWTGSRTACLALLLAILASFSRGKVFSLIILCTHILPVIAVYLYFYSDYQLHNIIETATSYRIVNWCNALLYLLDQPIGNLLFGIGHMPQLSEAYVSASYFDGTFRYKFVTYPESGSLRILINFGMFYYGAIIIFLFYLNSKLISRYSRILVAFISLSAISYDAVYSVQYFYILMLMFAQYYSLRGGNAFN